MNDISPAVVMKSLVQANNDGLRDRFDELVEALGKVGTEEFDLTAVQTKVIELHMMLQGLAFTPSIKLDLDFGVEAPAIDSEAFPGLLYNMGGTISLITDDNGIPVEGVSVAEMCEFDVKQDIDRVKDAMRWDNHRKRIEVGNLTSFHPFPAQAEGQPCALTHDHVLVLMSHRSKDDAWMSNGTRGVAVLLNHKQMDEVAQFVKTQIDHLHTMTQAELAEHKVETLEETYQTIATLLEEMAMTGEAQRDEDLFKLKAWQPGGKPS